MALSVIIPALNEQDAIEETVREVRMCLSAAGIEHEIIVVDDGSTDATRQLAKAAGGQVIHHLYSLGYGRSLKDGIRAARHDAIGITDADGTYPIAELPQLYEIYCRGYHMVVGQRTWHEMRDSTTKSLLRRLLNVLVEYTAGRSIPDINSGLRIFDRALAIHFFDRLCDTFSFTTSLTLAFIMNGLYVEHVPLNYCARKGQSKVRLLRDSLNTLQYVAEAAIYYNPLRMFLALSIGLLTFAFGLMVVNLFLQRQGILLATIGIFVASVLAMALGLIAVLLKQIMLSSEPKVPTERPLRQTKEAERELRPAATTLKSER